MSFERNDKNVDIQALAQAMDLFTHATSSMEEAYRRLEQRVESLDQELAQKNRDLALTTDYLGNLLESMSDGVLAVDAHGMITRFNRAASAITGYAAGEVLDRPFHEVFGRDFVAPRTPSGNPQLRAKSGRPVPVNERNSPVADREGRRMGYVKTFQDLSEIKALREQMRQVDRLAAIGEMAATVAHEIRNPLGGLRGFAALLARDLEEDDPRRRLVDKILAGAESLDKVVNELLEYTRPVELNLRPTRCGDIVEAACGYLEYDAQRIHIENAVHPETRVRADADKMRQVFLNILLNAVQSIPAQGRVRVWAQAEEDDVAVLFSDTGIGMDDDQIERVFSPFFTTKEKGTGLGLAVSQKIVEGHGGAILARSLPGEGTTITVRLPRTE
ncbi:MAG: two-component system sensor histidine kinase NtrB [Candidatus Hydrogenedentota bacterium]